MGNQPNLNLLNEMGRDIFGYNYKAIELRKVKKDGYFKRKPSAAAEYIRKHYNSKHSGGSELPASFTCVDAEYPWGGKEIYLKPSTVVFVEVGA